MKLEWLKKLWRTLSEDPYNELGKMVLAVWNEKFPENPVNSLGELDKLLGAMSHEESKKIADRRREAYQEIMQRLKEGHGKR